MPRPSSSSTANRPASPAWQTLATILLILHIFCVSLGLLVNAAGGASLLAPALNRIPFFQQYLQVLWMDVAYDYTLASPLPQDGVHTLRLTHANPAATEGDRVDAQFPTPDIKPRIRRARYSHLAYHVAYFDEVFAENPDLRTELPLAVINYWLRELDAPHQSYVLTCRRQPSERLPKAVEMAAFAKLRESGPKDRGPQTHDPVSITVNVIWNPDEGAYQGARADVTGQTAEVVRAAIESSAGTSPGNPPAGPDTEPANNAADEPTDEAAEEAPQQ